MTNRKMASVLTIAALFACSIPLKSRASFSMSPIIGQAAPSFSVPESIEAGTRVRISSSSDNMNTISTALGQGFERQYANSDVTIVTKTADAAIQDVLNDNADLAAISRPLTATEIARGLVAIAARREKIAIVISLENPFSQSLSGDQFAQIFRGEIQDWSEVGGAARPIRMIDRPDTSETRLALAPYPVFATSEFTTGDNAVQLSEDSIDALSQALGTDGIGYALVGQLEDRSDLKVLALHQTLPEDSRYPFSQPYAFVYNGAASPAATDFLGYATGRPGQMVIESTGVSGYSILPNGLASNPAITTNPDAGDAGAVSPETAALEPLTNGTPAETDSGTAGDPAVDSRVTSRRETPSAAVNTDGANDVTMPDTTSVTANGADETATGSAEEATGLDSITNRAGARATDKGQWWWLLLPLTGIGLLLWVAGKPSSEEETSYPTNSASDDERIGHNASRNRLDDESVIVRGDRTTPGAITGAPAGATAGATTAHSTSSSPASPLSGSGASGNKGINVDRTIAGGTAVVSGAAAARAEMTGRVGQRAGDITMDLDSIDDNAPDSTENSDTSGQNDQESQSSRRVDRGVRSDITDNTNNGIKTTLTSSDDTDGWLERAKQRINEATDQLNDTASEG